MASQRRSPRRRRRNKNVTEVQYEGSYKFIPELKMRVKIKKGETVKDWVIQYCRTNPHLKTVLYSAYKIKLKKR